MEKNFLKISFDKNFFSCLLHVKKEKLRYVFIVYKEDSQVLYTPALSVDGIKDYAYDISAGIFIHLSPNHSVEKVKVIKKAHIILFKNQNNTSSIKLVSFYRHYMTRIANELLA